MLRRSSSPAGSLLASSTPAMIFMVASVTSDVVDAPFQMFTFPVMRLMAKFQPNTCRSGGQQQTYTISYIIPAPSASMPAASSVRYDDAVT